MSDEIKKQHEREAARVNLRKMLETKKRGDRITASEVVESTGFAEWRSFGNTIRTFIRAQGFTAVPVRGDGWLISSPVSQIDDARKLSDSGTRKKVRALKAAASVPRAEIDERSLRRLEFITTRLAAEVEQITRHTREVREEFKLSERVPLRIAGK